MTPASDVFACNRKLISGQPFLDTYNAVFGDEPFPDSARDSEGHGTHTSTTAAGKPVAHAPILGVDRGPIHGMAPGAFVAVYKVCGTQSCFNSDSAAAVAQAILDGVKVINFSISGGAEGVTLSLTGGSATPTGVPSALPVVLASAPPYNNGSASRRHLLAPSPARSWSAAGSRRSAGRVGSRRASTSSRAAPRGCCCSTR